ncbi:MAG TPA: tetratricopeptide repeat protein, partial [Nostocaceae cyanobacterium]|nr:tetratricopeptide repeat protein [Nostocaceae cyanobacterium]
MKLRRLSHLLLFFFFLLPVSSIAITGCSSSVVSSKSRTFSEQELEEILKQITVKIIANNQEADSGTIIKNQNGFYNFLTNYHVVGNAKSLKVVTHDNQIYPAETVKLDRQDNQKDNLYDLAKVTFSSDSDQFYYVLTADHVVEKQQDYQVLVHDKQVYKVDNQTISRRDGIDMAVLQFSSSEKYQVATLGDYELKEQYVFLDGWRGEELNHPALFSVGGMLNADLREFWAKPRGYEYTENAVKAMKNAVIKYPNSWEAYYDVGWIWFRQDTYNLALNAINTAIREQPSFDSSYLLNGVIFQDLKEYETGVKALNQVILAAKEKDSSLYQVRGELFGELKKYQEAIADYNQAITINPQDAEAYYNRGIDKYELGDKAGAIADFTQAITINPQLAEAYYNRGVAKYQLGDKAGAIKDYNQAITINPQLAQAYSNRGLAKSELGDKAGAIQDYNQAITINPQDAQAYNNRGNAKSELGDKAGAIADFTQAITINPQLAQAYSNR